MCRDQSIIPPGAGRGEGGGNAAVRPREIRFFFSSAGILSGESHQRVLNDIRRSVINPTAMCSMKAH